MSDKGTRYRRRQSVYSAYTKNRLKREQPRKEICKCEKDSCKMQAKKSERNEDEEKEQKGEHRDGY